MAKQLEELVERRVAEWLARRERSAEHDVFPCTTICVGRDRGSGGVAVAQRLAELTGFEIYDHEIVDSIAKEAHIRTAVVESLDERTRSTVQDMLMSLVAADRFTYTAYQHHLSHVVLTIAHHGRAIILGRGANFIIPRGLRLAVRLTAPTDRRLARVMELQGCFLDEAERLLRETDEARIAFARRHFGADPRDATHYHMVLNPHALGFETSAHVINDAFTRWREAHKDL